VKSQLKANREREQNFQSIYRLLIKIIHKNKIKMGGVVSLRAVAQITIESPNE